MQPKTLQKILGHSNISMTMDLYVHVTEDQKQKEINNFLMKLQLMQANFELNHPKNEDEQK